MAETKELLELLDGKISRMLTEIERLKEVTLEKDQLIASLQSSIEQKNQTIGQLENECQDLKAKHPDEDQEALKFKIEEMVKEIDRCISLLKV